RQRAAVQLRDVVRKLTGRVRVVPQADRVGGSLQLRFGAPANQPGDGLVIVIGKHPTLREGQLVDRIVWDFLPVDQVVHDIGVGAEGEDGRNNLDVLAQLWIKLLDLR